MSGDEFKTQGGGGGIAPAPLSPIENMLVHVYNEFDRDSIGAVRCCVRGLIEEAPLRVAIAHVQRHHSKLQARVVSRGGKNFFEIPPHVSPIPLEIVDTDGRSSAWQSELYRGFAAPIDVQNGPMAAFRVIRNRTAGTSEIHFIIHHAIIDGFSAFRIMDELLGYYEVAEKGEPLPPVETRALITAPRATVTASLGRRLALMLNVVKHQRGKRRYAWTTMPDGRGVAPESCLESHVFSADETAALVRRCRAEKSFMVGTHFAAASCALAEGLAGGDLRLRCRVPVNIRASLIGQAGPVSADDVGCFIGAFEGMYAVASKPSYWDLARQISVDLRAYLKGSGPQVAYNLIRFARVSAFRNVKKRVTMAVNYLGDVHLRESYGSLRIESAMTMAKNVRLGPSLGILGLIVNGRLCFSVCGADLPLDFFKRFFESAVAQLRAAAQSQP